LNHKWILHADGIFFFLLFINCLHVPGWFCIHNLAFHLVLTRRGGAFQLEVIGIRAKAVGIRA
jgi:hypothetical protein